MARREAARKRAKKAAHGSKRARKTADLELDHLFLGTRDFNAAWKFWTEVVGLEGESKWGNPEYAGSVKFGRGSVVMAQGQEGPYEELGYTVEPGRLQLYVRTQNLDKLHKEMAARGAKILRAPLTAHWGVRCFSVEGPDGMAVVFSQSK